MRRAAGEEARCRDGARQWRRALRASERDFGERGGFVALTLRSAKRVSKGEGACSGASFEVAALALRMRRSSGSDRIQKRADLPRNQLRRLPAGVMSGTQHLEFRAGNGLGDRLHATRRTAAVELA